MAAEEATFESAGGIEIFYRTWQPAGDPRAVVVICHGVNSHGGQHAWAAEQLVASGYAVLAPNLLYRAGRSPLFDLDGLQDPEQRGRIFEQIFPLITQLTPEVITRAVAEMPSTTAAVGSLRCRCSSRTRESRNTS